MEEKNKLRSREPAVAVEGERREYVKPAIEDEEILETYALSCVDTPRTECTPRNMTS